MKRKTVQSRSLAPLQKTYGTHKPVRPYERFLPPKCANTGLDPVGGFKDFIKKDWAKPINLRKDHFVREVDTEHFESLKSNWAVGTQKFNTEKVDGSGKLERNFTPVSKHYIKTDHISVVPPERDRPFQKVYDKILTTPAYNKNNVCTNIWVPRANEEKSFGNRSSVGHNIITHLDNQNSGSIVMSVLDKIVFNRKKGVTEIADLNRLTALKSNKDFISAFEKNPHQFKRSNGVFSHLYDAAHRFGEDKPFKV